MPARDESGSAHDRGLAYLGAGSEFDVIHHRNASVRIAGFRYL
ncbi:hypothetical protein [Raineyella sp. W15-4]|nr:hypothetical protein [Raineyella sp. W15-4]WOQ17583.1 hypothetical protein R0145_02390 [Raineyella sp. W15-4]